MTVAAHNNWHLKKKKEREIIVNSSLQNCQSVSGVLHAACFVAVSCTVPLRLALLGVLAGNEGLDRPKSPHSSPPWPARLLAGTLDLYFSYSSTSDPLLGLGEIKTARAELHFPSVPQGEVWGCTVPLRTSRAAEPSSHTGTPKAHWPSLSTQILINNL